MDREGELKKNKREREMRRMETEGDGERKELTEHMNKEKR